MTLPRAADDKIEALVGLVLQAVDQRLTTVREQLVDLSNSVARRHGELGDQIAECRAMISSMASGAAAGSGAVAGSDPAADAAATQLLQAANILTERVTYLESRVNQYTNDRVAELRSAFEKLLPATAPPGGRPAGAVAPLAPPSRSIAQLGSLPAVASRAAPSNRSHALPDSVAAAPVPVAAETAAAPTAPATTTPTVAEFDIDAFTAQFNARLSALVERAIDA